MNEERKSKRERKRKREKKCTRGKCHASLNDPTKKKQKKRNSPKRPDLRRAGSNEFGRFVAPMTMTCAFFFMPSISVNNVATTRCICSSPTLSRFGAIASISSIKIIVGASSIASANNFLIFSSDSLRKICFVFVIKKYKVFL